jgi:hypothetical protein
MTVKELIKRLQKFPPDAPVGVGLKSNGEMFSYAVITTSDEDSNNTQKSAEE